MSSTKRKIAILDLQRRVRPRRESSNSPDELIEDEAPTTDGESSGYSSNEQVDTRAPESSSGSGAGSGSESESDSRPPAAARSISFGSLAKAQASFTPSGRRGSKAKELDHEAWGNQEAKERKVGRKDHRDFNRSNKHAPTEISSKKAVSRRREVVHINKREARDPRFESLGGFVDETKVKAAYAFLDDYREDEIKELKGAIRTTKDEDAKGKLRRALSSMESRKKAQSRKAKEQEILDRHRKEEKELVKQGKTPFYLKKAEQKKRVLLDQFSTLKGKQLDHVIERRRKKVEGKEKRNMPFSRRGTE